MQEGAFIGWQITEFVKLALNNKAQPLHFGAYLQDLGLIDPPAPANKKDRKKQIEQRIKKAERIKAKDSRRKVSN